MSQAEDLSSLCWTCHECTERNRPYYFKRGNEDMVPSIDLICDRCRHGYCSQCQIGQIGLNPRRFTELKLDKDKDKQGGRDAKSKAPAKKK